MTVNSSFTSSNPLVYHCSNSKAREFIFISLATVKTILLLPLSTFILHMGYQRWRQQRSFNTASHSDLFTYHLAAMELFWGVGMVCYLCGLYCNNLVGIMLALYAFAFTVFGELFFHLLTCVERYLAVVHPITYRGLRSTRGVRIRNVSISCVWLLSFGLLAVQTDSTNKFALISVYCLLGLTLIVMSFCSLSVLWALNRQGPGEVGGDKHRVDQSKQRAFYTITAILSVLWLWFVGLLISSGLQWLPQLDESISCVLTASLSFFNLPTSLVSPVLYLLRAGKLFYCCCNHK